MIRSPIKYPGSKRLILDKVLRRLGSGKRLVEPFCGSCVVGLNANFEQIHFNDINADLIQFYRRLSVEKHGFMKELSAHFLPESNTADYFYEARKTFNASVDPDERASLFFYLSRHSFNSLIRFNAKGAFNAPFGRYDKPYFPAVEFDYFISQAARFTFSCLPFDKIFNELTTECTVYADPPYVPASDTANFTSYQSAGFSVEQQVELARLCEVASLGGHHVVISNHSTKFTRSLYSNATQYRFSAPRTISSATGNRKPAAELLATFR